MSTLLGGWLVVRFLQGRAETMRHLSGIAAGYLVAVTLVRILPEAIEHGGRDMALWALGGFVTVHILEHGITPHFHYGEETHDVGSMLTGILALVGLSFHSLMDGAAITAAMQTHMGFGVQVSLGILLHRIPEGGTISSIFLVKGFGKRGAIAAAAVLAVAAMVGAIGQGLIQVPLGPVLGMTAGLGLYVASSDLLPEAQKEKGWKSSLGLLVGIALFLATLRLTPHAH